MKQYEVTLTGHFEKTVSIYADSPEQVAEKLKIILFDTDLVRFSDGDFVCGEADIKDENEDGCEEMESEGGGFENEDCSDCPYFCPVCGECSICIPLSLGQPVNLQHAHTRNAAHPSERCAEDKI